MQKTASIGGYMPYRFIQTKLWNYSKLDENLIFTPLQDTQIPQSYFWTFFSNISKMHMKLRDDGKCFINWIMLIKDLKYYFFIQPFNCALLELYYFETLKSKLENYFLINS